MGEAKLKLMAAESQLAKIYGVAQEAIDEEFDSDTAEGTELVGALTRISELAKQDIRPRSLETAEVSARTLGRHLAPHVPPGWGFLLVLASFGEGGRMTYLSNCQREDMINLMKELSGKLEAGEPEL